MSEENNRPPTRREQLYENYEARAAAAPNVEEVQPLKKEEPGKAESVEIQEPEAKAPEVKAEEPEKQLVTEEKPKRKYAGKFESDEELEKGYLELEKGFHEKGQKASELEKAFQQLKPYVNWDKIQAEAKGQPYQPQPPTQPTPPPAMDKEKFFQDFAERGPVALDDYIAKTPVVQQQVNRVIQQLIPTLSQNIEFKFKLDNAYEAFQQEFPHLKNFEEDVGKIMMQDISQNPRKSLVKAMRDAAGQMQKLLDTYKEEGKKEADTIHEEKKLENLPPGDRASKDKTRTGPAKVVESEEDKPQTLADYVQMRRNVSQKRKTEVGYQYRK